MTAKLRGLLELLEERLVEHNESRKEVQDKLHKACIRIMEDADTLEEKISEEIHDDFKEREERVLGLIEELKKGEGDVNALTEQAQEVLATEWKYEIRHSETPEESFVDSYKLEVSSAEAENEIDSDSAESAISHLETYLDKIHDFMTAAQEKLIKICNGRRKEAEELETRINGKLEEPFNQEDARIQSLVKAIRENFISGNSEEVDELERKAKLTLLRNQKYSLIGDSLNSYDLKVEREALLKFIDFEERKPTNFNPSFTEKGELSLSFSFFREDEVEVLKDVDSPFEVKMNTWEKDNEKGTSKTLTKELILGSDKPVCFKNTFTASTTYFLKMRIVQQEVSTQWSDESEFTTPEFKDLCVWKECPDDVDDNRKYSVDEKNPRIATKIGGYYCTIIGNTPLPLNKVISWSIKVLKSKDNDGDGINIGVAPFEVNQNICNYDKCGWYFYCYYSQLYSGPPHNYSYKDYGPRKKDGQYVHTGDSVGVVMDTTKGDLSFMLNGVNLGVAYEGIPLDKPLVPCVILLYAGESVEIIPSEAKEKSNDSNKGYCLIA